MLEPIIYDIGRICKETYKTSENKEYTPKIIDNNIWDRITPPLLRIPFDCPREVMGTLTINNKKKVFGIFELENKSITYYIVNFGKYVDSIDINNLIELNPDLVIIGDSRRLIKRKELIQLIKVLREIISPNTAIYFPNALPWEIPLLVYLGVDYFDYSSAHYYASLGYYFTKNRLIPINSKEREGDEMDFIGNSNILNHNKNIINLILNEVKYGIKEGCLRNIVEETTLSDPYLRGNYKRYNPDLRNIPLSKGKKIIVSIDENDIPEVKKYIERIKNYEVFTNTIVLLPCSSKKPYSHSKSHKYFINAINSNNYPVEEVIITSPYGIVPRALEGVVNYDIPVTGKWSLEEIEFINSQLNNYLKNASKKYGHLNIICHLPDHYLDILDEDTYKNYGDYIITSNGNPISLESLENLKNTLKNLKNQYNENQKNLRKNRKMQIIHNYRELAKFQFNKNFIPEDVIIKGKHKKFFIKRENKLVQICSLNPENGLFVLTYEGGKLLGKINWVEVNFEIKKGSLFAPGLKDCDENISVNDEVVIIYEDRIVGVGRAILSGFEMKKAKHGLLVNIRHVNYDN
ncbi:MAG TPA: Archaeosine synthase [Methanothermococcus okinawensis]|uniref:Archaeosine synthase n=1 Tax=Methanothermococcus okinawensis TaxID=155863 RepID=A0A832YXD5_9EURY|nr:Archaeosine synthase [Methanothermococcus okinawensis]